MQGFIIQEYNRKTKKYRDLGAISARNKEEAKQMFLKASGWKSTKELLLHVEDSSDPMGEELNGNY